jgi:hypothetical protein
MRQKQYQIVFILALASACALLGIFAASAQQQSAQGSKQTQSPAQQKEEEPVAITDRTKVEKAAEPKAITGEQFGNFRPPIINNKGEVAFVGMFNSPKAKNGFGQAIFVRLADGSWKVVREGEKASNLPESVSGFGGLPAFNNNGDITFIADFGADTPKPAAHDHNNPDLAQGQSQNKSLFLKTASGLKSLVKLGDEVPAMPSHFSGFANASTNTQGVTAFIGTYSDPDGRGLFMIEQGKLRLVCRSGQRIGNGEEGTFSEHYYPTHINERGEVAFLARIGDKSGIFVSRPKGIELITITGKPAPISGSSFIGFGNRTPAINSSGEVVFVGFVDNAESQRALFSRSADAAAPIKVVAKMGDKFGDTNYAFTDFLYPAINGRGDVAFLGKFGRRNQGLFIKTAKGIEPIALVDQPVPGGDKEETFNNFMQPSINDRGEVVFYGQTKNPKTGVEVGIFMRDEKGNVKWLVKRGDKMPK